MADPVTNDPVLRSLTGLELALVRHRRAVRRRLGVSDEELTALLYVAHHGGVPQARLAPLTALSRSGLGALVQRLEQAGLVERHPAPGDRRLRLIRLAPAGRERLDAAYRELETASAGLLAGVSPAERDALERLLTGLARATDAVSAEPAPAPAPSAAGDPIWRSWG